MLIPPGRTLVVSFVPKNFRLAMRARALLLSIVALVGSFSRAAAQIQPERAVQIPAPSSGPNVDGLPGATAQPAQPGLVHIVPFGRNQLKNALAPAGAHLTYWGGPVISQIHAIAVFWGANVNTAITTPGAIDQYFTDITNSRHYDLLTEYSTAGITGAGVPATSSNQSIQRGVFDGMFTITPAVCNVTPPATCTVTDDQIQAELRSQINAGHLPQPVSDAQGNVNSFYMIYFPPGVSITVGTVASCVSGGFCAYHSNTPNTLAPRLVPYGVLPDFAPPSGCSLGCGRGTLFQNVTAVTSHEMSEAVTDPQVGSATTNAAPLAWYDFDPPPNGLGEIGDICGGQDVLVTAGTNSYMVQTEFSNLQNDCVSAPPNFNLSPPAGGVAPAVSFNLPLTIQSSTGPVTLTGYNGTVHFTSSDPTAVLPADYTFTAADLGTHTFPVTLSTLGDQTITVTDTRSGGFVGTATTNVNTTPDLTIAKTHAGNLAVGQSGSYTITVSNTGNGPTTATVTVVDSLPTSLTATAIAGTGWSCTLATLTCTRADVLARGANYPAITLAVNVGPSTPPSITNFATVSGGGEANTANDSASDFALVASPDLIVSKSHAGAINGNFLQGETGATYNINVTNIGIAPTILPVTVVDTLPPAGLTATAISGTGWTCTLATLTCTRSDVLAPGGSYPIITLTVDVALNAPGTVINTATVSGGGETLTTNDLGQDFTVILPPPAPDLAVFKSHVGPINGNFFQGETGASYTITVVNFGNASTSGLVSVVDTLPSGLTATAISGTGWSCTLANLTCTRNDALGVGSTYPSITVTVDVALNAPSNVTNIATVSGGGEANTANDVAQDLTVVLPPPAADLAISVLHTASFFVQGQTGSYVINVSNAGTAATNGAVTVKDTLPTGLTATSIAGTGWACDLPTLTCTRSDSLAFNFFYPSITLAVNVASNAPASVTNSATVSGGADTNAANNTSSDPTQIVAPVVDLRLSMLVRAISFIQGQTNNLYTLTATNQGTVSSAGTISVATTLSPGLVVTAITGPGWSCALATLTCTRPDALAVNSAFPDISVTFNVSATAPANAFLTAKISGGGNTGSNTDAGANFTIAPMLSITPTTQSATITAGQSALFGAFVSPVPTAGTVTFSCGPLPSAASCSFNPVSTTIPTTVGMTIKTTSRVATAGSRFQVPHNSSPFLLIMGAALLAVAFANRAGTMRKLAPVFGLAGILVILAGCGGGSNPPPPPVQTGTPAGTYNITMTANSSTGGTAVQTFTLTVQ